MSDDTPAPLPPDDPSRELTMVIAAAPVLEGGEPRKQPRNFAKHALKYRTEILPPT